MKGSSLQRHPLDGVLTREGVQRLRHGHPWLFQSHLGSAWPHKKSVHPKAVQLGEHWFLFSPQSNISLRRLGPASRFWPTLSEPETKEFSDLTAFGDFFSSPLLELIDSAYERKVRALGGERCFRWIFSEADLVPGLVVDLFDREMVVQLQSAPVEWLWPLLKELLVASFRKYRSIEIEKITELRGGANREKEGLAIASPTPETTQARRWIEWNGLGWSMAPGVGQKTGAYFDQRDNHRRALHWAQSFAKKRAWDLCCFEGGFGLHLARAGIEVEAVDVSDKALQVARQNAQHNGISESLYQTRQADVFEFLRARFDEKARVPMIVLDPPSFSKSRKDVDAALKGFKELNLRAMHTLEPGGILVSCACSHSISREDYAEMLRSASRDARRAVHVLEVCGPAPDHSPLLGFPESEYLQAWFLEVR